MIIWTPAVLSVLYTCVSYFCICPCSAQLSMFHMERRSRNMLIIITIFISITSHHRKALVCALQKKKKKITRPLDITQKSTEVQISHHCF